MPTTPHTPAHLPTPWTAWGMRSPKTVISAANHKVVARADDRANSAEVAEANAALICEAVNSYAESEAIRAELEQKLAEERALREREASEASVICLDWSERLDKECAAVAELVAALERLTNQTTNLVEMVKKTVPIDVAFRCALESARAAIARAKKGQP